MVAETLDACHPGLLGFLGNRKSDHCGTLMSTRVVCIGTVTADPSFQGPSFLELAQNYQTSITSLAYTINGPLVAYGIGVRNLAPTTCLFL